ncbi:hypothetical protein KY359_06100 [Candidatus Woesearchaeota archaeon]|nr:hypothetical protein [Candidatus Woesearchaeota archaeon]
MAKRKTSAGDTKKHASGRKKGAIELTPDKYFVLRSGTPIRSIEELAMMLDTISDEDFGHHVTESKNDFSTWINDVFGKKDLAESLLKTKDKKESQIVLLKHTTLKVK